MKKIFLFGIVSILVGCSLGGFPQKLAQEISDEKNTVSIADITDFDWTYLRIIRPYESRKVFGEQFNQDSDDACLWVFTDPKTVIKKFEIAREKVECIDLPNKTFGRGDTIFLIRDGKLQERKKFSLPGK